MSSERISVSKSFVARLRERVTSLYDALRPANPSLSPAAGDSQETLGDKFFGLLTALGVRGSSSAVSVASEQALASLDSSGFDDGTVVLVNPPGEPARSYRYSTSASAGPRPGTVDSISGGHFSRSQVSETAREFRTYSGYQPTVTRGFVLDHTTSPYKYNHDASIAWYVDRWYAVWNANTNQFEGNPGQVNLMSTSFDGVAWSAPVVAFSSPEGSSNPVVFDASDDLQWQPNLLVVGSELWCMWSQQVDWATATYPTGFSAYFSKLLAPGGKWINQHLTTPYSEDGNMYYPFPSQNPVQLRSGRVLAPVTWVSNAFVSPVPPAWGSNTGFWTNHKRAGVLYTDDGGDTWVVSGTTTLPGYDHVTWEPVASEGPDGTLRMYCRNLDYKSFNASQYLLTCEGFADGAQWGPLRISPLEGPSSRLGLLKQASRVLGVYNDSAGGSFVSDRKNGALFFGTSASDDLVPGTRWSADEAVVAYPQADIAGGDVVVIYSQGEVPRSIKWARISPAPPENQLLVVPRENQSYTPFVIFRPGPPAYFEHGSSSLMSSVLNTSSWSSAAVSVGGWVYLNSTSGSATFADTRALSRRRGVFFGHVSGFLFASLYDSAGTTTNLSFSSVAVPANQWVYVGLSVTPGGSAIAYLVDAAGVATTQTLSCPAVAGFDGDVVNLGVAAAGSSLQRLVGRIRRLSVWDGVALSADNHRYLHELDRTALSASDWVGIEANPGTAPVEYSAADLEAGTNSAAWLAKFSATGSALQGTASVSGSLLTVSGAGSASVELPADTQYDWATSIQIPSRASGFDQVYLTLGDKGTHYSLVSPSATPTKIVLYDHSTATSTELVSTIDTTRYIPVTLRISQGRFLLSVDGCSEVSGFLDKPNPRLFFGSAYSGWSMRPTDSFTADLAATGVRVSRSQHGPSRSALSGTSLEILSNVPEIRFKDVDVGHTARIRYNNTTWSFDRNDGNTVFSLASATGTIGCSGDIESQSILYSTGGSSGGNLTARRFNGTFAAPTAVLSNDILGNFYTSGHTGSGYSAARTAVRGRATQNWSAGANGAKLEIDVTPNGSTTRTTVWTFEQSGDTTHTSAAPIHDVVASGGSSGWRVRVTGHTAFLARFLDSASSTVWSLTATGEAIATGTASRIRSDGITAAGQFLGVRYNGTALSPTAVASGDQIANFLGTGYTGSAVAGGKGGLAVFADENWTGSANGVHLELSVTPTGSTTRKTVVNVSNAGNVKIAPGGATAPAASTALDVESTTGFFLPPRMTTAQRDAIASPLDGSMLYNVSLGTMQYRKAGAWVSI